MANNQSKKHKPKKRHDARENFQRLLESPPDGIEWNGIKWNGIEWARNNLREAAKICGCVHGTITRFADEVDAGAFTTKPARKETPPEIREARRMHAAVMAAMTTGPVPLPDYDPGEIVKLHVAAQNYHQKLVARASGTPFGGSTLTDAEAMSPFVWVGAGSHMHLAKVRSQESGREGELFRGFLRRVRSATTELAPG